MFNFKGAENPILLDIFNIVQLGRRGSINSDTSDCDHEQIMNESDIAIV